MPWNNGARRRFPGMDTMITPRPANPSTFKTRCFEVAMEATARLDRAASLVAAGARAAPLLGLVSAFSVGLAIAAIAHRRRRPWR